MTPPPTKPLEAAPELRRVRPATAPAASTPTVHRRAVPAHARPPRRPGRGPRHATRSPRRHVAVSLLPTSVVSVSPRGPVFAGRRARMRRPQATTFVRALRPGQRVVVAALTLAWAAAVASFWMWWLQPDHRVAMTGLVLNSVLLGYLTAMPAYFLIMVNRLPQVNPAIPVPALRVAFVVTKAPSEPWDVARTTLQAMLAQDYPHPYDVWLCDERPSQETLAWCADHGVRVSSREGVAEYHQEHYPRRTKCKEGNLAYFYDHWGYRDYDAVAQLDCDHVPTRTYLAEMMRPFADPAIGYVAAPSVCDSNAATSWSARGRLHREGTFHGAFQLGHNNGLAPVGIGSHYAVRTAAVQDIGGIGPELAEDFTTSFLLTSAGWVGAFAHRADASGEGPHTFAALLTQEFQWSRSLVTVLYDLLPAHLARFPWRLRLRFLFALTYYPLVALTVVSGLLLPAIAAASGITWVHVPYLEFVLRFALINLCLVVLALLVRRWGLFRPRNAPVVSWENWLYSLARWPYITWGVLAATRQKLSPKPVVFRVTPKQRDGLEPLPARLTLPYAVTSLVMSGAALTGELLGHTTGYALLCLLSGLSFATVSTAIPLLHAREAGRDAGVRLWRAASRTVRPALLLAATTWGMLVPGVALFLPFAATVLRG